MRAFDGIVGVDQVYRGITQQILQPLKGFALSRKGLNPGMRGRSEYRDAIAEAGLGIAGADASADVGGAAGQDARFGRVRAARAKIHHSTAPGHFHHARCLGRDQGLEADGGEQIRFGDLRFDQRRAHS